MTKRRNIAVCIAWIALAASVVLCALWLRPPWRARGPLPHEAYVWQRAWTDPVRRAVEKAAPKLAGLVVLNAEVAWEQNRARVVRVPIDYAALRAVGRPVGLALRIGPYPGPFAAEGGVTTLLVDLATSLVDEADKNRLRPAELQIDFDCADSKLDGYRVWVEAIRRQVAPVPVTITALPSWLRRPELKRLAAAADEYVLQVHSLTWPTTIDAAFSFELTPDDRCRMQAGGSYKTGLDQDGLRREASTDSKKSRNSVSSMESQEKLGKAERSISRYGKHFTEDGQSQRI